MLNPCLRACRHLVVLLVLLAAATSAWTSEQTLGGNGGDPLLVTVSDTATVDIQRFNAADQSFEDQYYPTDYNTFLVTTPATGSAVVYSGNDDLNNVTTVSNSTTAPAITTVISAGDNISITHTLTYLPGSSHVQHTWTLLNQGTTTYRSLALRYGGDTHFDNDDSALGFYDPSIGMVYSVNPGIEFPSAVSGIMGLYADPLTPSTNYFEGAYQDNTANLESVAPLSNSVLSTYVDNGVSLEWIISGAALTTFNQHGSITYTAWEVLDTPLQATVTPAPTTVLQGTTPTTLTYSITNLQSSADTFDLVIQASPGIEIASWGTTSPVTSNPSSIALGANAQTTLTVTVIGSPELASSPTQDAVSVLVRSQTTPTIINQGTTPVSGESSIILVAPVEQAYLSGQPVTAQFTMVNNETTFDSFVYNAQGDPGITVTDVTFVDGINPLPSRLRTSHPLLRNVPSSVDNLQSTQSSTITVTFTVDPTLAGSVAHLTLTATSQSDSTITDSITALCDIAAANTQVQVIAPAASSAPPGGIFPITFHVDNLEAVADTFSIAAVSSAGYSVVSVTPSSVQLGPNGSIPVVVLITAGGPGSSGTVSITVTSLSIPTITSSSVAAVSVPGSIAPTPTPGAAVTAPANSLPLSSNGHIVFIPFCPSTPEGVSALLTTLAGLGSGDAVAYAWDASVQGYAQLPAVPVGGLQPTNGVFIATSVGLDLDTSGTSELNQAIIPLQHGWNLFGVPPVDFGGGVHATSHQFPGDFQLLDPVSGVPVTSLAEFVSILGTGTTDLTTTRPYFYDGTTYTQVSTLTSGTAYWIFNSASVTVYLERVQTGPTLSALRTATLYAGAQATSSQPPSVPSSGLSASGGSSGCGISAGAGLMMGLALLWWRRRH
jgi:hypothetical protein